MSGRYTSKSQQRLLTVVLALGGNVVDGVAPGVLARKLNIAPALITRDLDNLLTAGCAERVPGTDNWRLSPRIGQIALEIFTHVDRSQAKLDEVRNRYTRNR